MSAQKIKKGDTVVLLVGSKEQRGRTGEVLKVMPKENKLIVAGLNIRIRHTKPTQADPQGGKKPFEAPLHISNVAIADKNGKPTRVRFEMKDGKKVRVAVKSGQVL
jgi:large subunit ribosomal protein L24